MLVVPGKSRISHHSSPPAFGSAPFCSRIHGGTVAPSVFSRVFRSSRFSRQTSKSYHPVLSSRGTLVCLSSPFEQNTTENEYGYGSRRRFSASEDHGHECPPSIFQYRSPP